jgi:uncharacterized protein (TIRG00374 family)
MTKSSKRIRILISAAGVALAAYLLYDIFRTTDLRQTANTIESVSLIGVIMIFVPSIVGAFIDAFGWKKLLPVHIRRPESTSIHAFWQVLRVRIASEAVVNTVPLGSVISDPLKAWMLRKYVGISTASGIASVALRTFLLAESQSFIVLIVSIAGFGWLSAMSEGFIYKDSLVWFSLSISILALIIYTGLIIASCSGSLTKAIHRKLSKIKIARFRDWILDREKYFQELNNELATFANERRKTLFYVVILYVFLWSMEGVETYIILHYLGVSVSFSEAYAVEAICSFIRSVAVILPSGLGAQDAGYVAFLNGMGESQPVAVAFVLIKRLRQLVWVVAGGLLLLAFRRSGTVNVPIPL